MFRRYHRWLAIVCALPLLLTVMTGMTFPLAEALNQRQFASWLVTHALEEAEQTNQMIRIQDGHVIS